MRTGGPEIVVVAGPDAVAREVAARFVTAATEAIAERGRFTVALSGGSTPKAAYSLLARESRDALDWNAVRFFFGDERCVPPDDAESNYRTAHERLLEPIGIEPTHVFRMAGETDPAAAARAYATIVRAELGGEPRLDLVMLGMGPDGHTASLFPGTDPFDDDAALVRAPYVAAKDGYRLTLTPSVLNGGRTVVIATDGDAKADALARVLDGPYLPYEYPIQVIAPRDGRLAWIVDEAAAAKLE